MTPASSKTQIIWLEDRIVNLEKKINEMERRYVLAVGKPDVTQSSPTTRKQWGWTLIPKPLTDEAVGLLIGNSGIEGQSWLMSVVRAVERAHGIEEK